MYMNQTADKYSIGFLTNCSRIPTVDVPRDFMARPKEFDPGEAMREAMAAFWERGYHATSVSDLLSEMKLNRGSLYGTFGDKKRLFLATLAEYEKQSRETMRETLEQPG